jgi:hypothetical protein
VKRYTKKSLIKRSEVRGKFPEFYAKHVGIIKETKSKCTECGCNLIGDSSEVAHILNKSRFKSVSTKDDNIIYLCSWKSPNNCHAKFDNSSLDVFKDMIIYHQVCNIFSKLKDVVKEKIDFKTLERFTKNY